VLPYLRVMSQKTKLTKRIVDAAKPPKDSQAFEITWDTEISGFGLRTTKAGIKSYILQYRIHGRQRRFTIGRHGVLTAEQARQKAIKLRGDIAEGNDPQGTKKQLQGIPTFEAFSAEYIDRAKKTKKTWQKDQGLLDLRILPKLGQYRLDTITTRQIESLHNDVKHERSPATANRHLAQIKRMFSLAIQWGYIEINPAQTIKNFKENNERTAWLDADQISALLSACKAYESPYVGALFPFLLFTGARIGEALAARWENVDLERSMWLILEAKSGKGRYVPLSTPAVDALRALPRQSDSPYVFCGHLSGKPLVNAAKPWKRIKAAANLPEAFRIHDLRHTFASWGVSNGIDLYHIQSLLGHSSFQMTQRYSHLAEEGIKASVDHISDRINSALQQNKNNKELVSDE